MSMAAYSLVFLLAISLFPGAPPDSTSSKARWSLSYSNGGPERFHGLSFSDATNGWMVGASGRILHSRDAGHTWEPQASPAKIQLTCVQFVNAQSGWAAGQSNTVLMTRDAGRSWVVDHPPGRPARRTLMALRDGWIGTDSAISSRREDTPPLFRTTDGGQSWSVQGHWPGTSIRSLRFHDTQSGLRAEFSGVYSTKDGRVSWVKELDSGGDPFVQMVFVGRSRGWVLTFTGKVYTCSE
jgi:photosystem II stability/assembly factor-like uncharacterized protein